MQILLSQPVVDKLHTETRQRVAAYIDQGIDPQLAVVMVGNNPASVRYVRIKSERAKELGIICSVYHLEEDIPYEHIAETVKYLADDEDIHGIIIQLPLPAQFSREQTDALIELIPEIKDVDGLRGTWLKDEAGAEPLSLSGLLHDHPHALPPMVLSVVSLLDFYSLLQKDSSVVLVGEGRLVGAPLLQYFRKVGMPAVAVNEETEDILKVTQIADVLIAGTGQPDLITYQWIKEGAVVIDCAQDVHRDSIDQLAGAVAPSKGGVGPLTVAWLLYNLIQAVDHQLIKSHV